MANELSPLGMNSMSPVLPQDRPTDMPMGEAPNNLDEDDIRQCVLWDFQSSVKDKEDAGWIEKREYDLKSYYGIKDAAMMRRPWPGASAYPVPITPTLLDTAHANIKASIKSDDDRWCRVTGVGEEDIRKAVPLESLLNWQLSNQINIDRVEDLNIFRGLLNGNGIVKVMQDLSGGRSVVKTFSIDVENFYIPIDAEGVQFGENNGHATQIIPLSQNDVEMRKLWGIYKDLDKMAPGARIYNSGRGNQYSIQKLKDHVTGQDMERKQNRDTYFLAETYKEYFPKNGSGYGSTGPTRAGARPVYIIVWWSPNGGTIHRIAMMDEDKVVPFANHDLYPNPGYFFSMSLPDKLRNVQEKANYADKQNTDAMDRSISPAMFVSDTAELEKSRAKRIPGGIYNLGRDQSVFYEPQPPRERGFEGEIQRMWIEGQQLTGLIDISYGGNTRDKTLGQTQIRDYRAGIRFKDILDRYERGFKDKLDLIYHYDNKFMDRRTKVKVLGYADYKTIDELFPSEEGGGMGLGIEGKFDFSFAGIAVTEREKQKQDKIVYYSGLALRPDVLADPGKSWKVDKELSEAYGIRDIEKVLSKPPQALVLSAQEAIQRVVSGQTDIPLRAEIDTDSYIYEIGLFMRTETFLSLMPQLRAEILKMFKNVHIMRAFQMRAILDLQIVDRHQQAQSQALAMVGQEQNGNGTGRTRPQG